MSIFFPLKARNLYIIVSLAIFFIGPSLMMRWVIYLFDIERQDVIAAIVWFSFLGIRTLICLILIWLLIRSFRTSKNMLKAYAILFLLLEIPFSFISSSYGLISYSSVNWHCMYWHPLNSLGYRDREPPDSSTCRRKIVVVGDSYSTGDGIKYIKHRYDRLLEDKLGDGWCVYSAAESGIDTKEELKRISAYPVKGNYTVLQYYMNDIDICWDNYNGNSQLRDDELFLNPAITASAIVNFLIIRLILRFDYSDYLSFMKEVYNNAEVLQEHYNDLIAIIDYTKDKHSKLVVLIYPELTDLETSNKIYVDKISAFFQDKGCIVISVGDLVKKMPVKERIVSPYDTHGGVKVHEMVAGKLAEVIAKEEEDGKRLNYR